MGQIVNIESRLNHRTLGSIFETPAKLYVANFAPKPKSPCLSFQLEPEKPNPKLDRLHIQSTKDHGLWSIYAMKCTDPSRRRAAEGWDVTLMHEHLYPTEAFNHLWLHVSAYEQKRLYQYLRGLRTPRLPQQQICLPAAH